MELFWYKFAPKRPMPLSDYFTKFCRKEGVPGPHTHAKFYPKIAIFVYIFPRSVYPLKHFTKSGMGRKSWVRTLAQNYTVPLWL